MAIKWLEWRSRAIPARKIIYSVARDISKRRLAEEKVRTWEQIFKNADWGVAAGGTHLQLMNPAFAGMHGYTMEELLNRPVTEVFAPASRANLSHHLRITDEKGHHTFESEQIRKDGTTFPCLADFSVVKNDRGEFLFRAINILDITERKRAEAIMMEREARLRSYFEIPLVAIAVSSPEKGWIEMNSEFLDMLDYTKEELARLTWDDLTYPDDIAADTAQFERMMRGEINQFYLEKRLISKSGEIIYTLLSAACVRKPDQSLDYVVDLLQDITARKKAEKRLEKMAEELKEINATKDKLFSIIAHDLRGPMGSFHQGLEILRSDKTLDEDLKVRKLEQLTRAAKTTYSLLENLLNWSQSQTNAIKIEAEHYFLEDSLQGVVEQIRPLAIEKEIDLQISAGSRLGVYADKNSINLVIRNLLSNAIKFTPHHGRVTLSAADAGSRIQVEIVDNGIGMIKEVLQNLFKTNSYFSSFGTDKEKGSGIGLVLCKDFVERNGGTIQAESVLGEGSRFIFTIPTSDH